METLKIVCPECHNVNTVTKDTMACAKCQEDLDHPFAVEVTDESAKTHIDENDIAVLVDFYSTTCATRVWQCMKTMKMQRLDLVQQ